MIEKFMQFFVGVIDTKLLEWIKIKIFKSENVKYAEKTGRILAGIGAGVNMIDKPSKSSWI